MIKRLISIILTLWLVLMPFSGAEYSVPVTVEGAIFGGDAADKIPLTLKFDSKWVTAADNEIYNGKLAAFSAVLCADSYFRTKDIARGTVNRVVAEGDSEYTQTALLEKLGYTDVRFVETYKEKQYSADTNDSATMLIGYKNVNGKYDSYIVAFRGCYSIGERLSIFDIGAETEEYTALTGTHTEWKNKSMFKGLNVAVNRAEDYIAEYMALHGSPDCADTVLVTGHSRGAALANVIGADFEKNEAVKSYTYTFNAMPVTDDESAAAYKTVFNVFDTNDYYVNPLPFANESCFRFGRDISADIAQSKAVLKAVAELKGRDDYTCLSPESRAEYNSLFAEKFPDRESLYVMRSYDKIFDSSEEANSEYEYAQSVIAGLGISDFCRVSAVTETENGKFSFVETYCPAALLFGLAQIQAYGQSAYDAFLTIFADDAIGCRLAAFTFDNLAQMAGGHLLINGYVLAGKESPFSVLFR